MTDEFVDTRKVESRTRLLDGFAAAGYSVGSILDVVIAWIRGKKCRTATVNLWTDGAILADAFQDVVGVTGEKGDEKFVLEIDEDISSETKVRAFNVASSLNTLIGDYAKGGKVIIGVPEGRMDLIVNAMKIVEARMKPMDGEYRSQEEVETAAVLSEIKSRKAKA
jgi:hypothetical protein